MNAIDEGALAARLTSVRERIRRAAEAAGRDVDSVHLLAVSKHHPPEAMAALYRAGQRAFGESYVQEALAKQAALVGLPLEWHFIGPLQGNKTRKVAENFAWVHGVDRERIARRLSEQRPEPLGPLQVCIQVNVSGEASKSGVAPEAALELAREVVGLPNLRLRGLMALPARSDDPQRQRRPFALLRELRDDIAAALGEPLDTLSMGMSGDLEAAVREGATWVRVGTALFGPRADARRPENGLHCPPSRGRQRP